MLRGCSFFDIKRSQSRLVISIVIHVCCLLFIGSFVNGHGELLFLLILLIGYSFYHSFSELSKQYQLQFIGEDSWLVNSTRCQIELSKTKVNRYYAQIAFKQKHGPVKSIVLFFDSMADEEWRRLSAYLRHL